jgi:hypothetical protein
MRVIGSVTGVAGFVVGVAAALFGGQGPETAPSPGLYLEREQASGPPALERLEASRMIRTSAKDIGKTMATAMLTGGMLGGKPKVALVFEGASASLGASSRPVFQFHFTPQAPPAPRSTDPLTMMDAAMQGDSGMPECARQPHDFALVRLGTKNGEREMVASTEMKPKDAIPIRARTLGPTAYRVAADRDLEPGEYGFVCVPRQGSTVTSDQLWGFRVEAK